MRHFPSDSNSNELHDQPDTTKEEERNYHFSICPMYREGLQTGFHLTCQMGMLPNPNKEDE